MSAQPFDPNKVTVYAEDPPEHVDYLTVIMDGSVFGMNDAPTHPLGFSQYTGEEAEINAEYRAHVAKSGTPYRSLRQRMGKRLKWEDVPSAVREHIEARWYSQRQETT